MNRASRFGGIRVRLALAISVTTLVAVVLSFFALERGTEQDLKQKIDKELTAQHDQFATAVADARVKNSRQLHAVVKQFVARQRYRPASRILLINVDGYPTATNQQEVLDREIEHESEHGGSSAPAPVQGVPQGGSQGSGSGETGGDDGGNSSGSGESGGSGEGSSNESGGGEGSGGSGSGDGGGGSGSGEGGGGEGSNGGGGDNGGDAWIFDFTDTAQAAGSTTLVNAPTGFSTIDTQEAGQVRVITKPVVGVNGRRLGTFRAADPLASVELTREGLRNTFLIVGLAALLMSTAVAIWLASVITRPLRRMTRFASAVDAGDLAARLEYRGGGDEVDVLAESFDGMLDRLQEAFKRQQDFVSDASHELRTPLTVIRGQIELLQRGVGDQRQRERTVATVLAEIDRMNRLVDDMLVLARAEEGTLVHRRKVDVQEFFEDVRRDVPLLGDRHYDVSTDIDGTIEIDPDRISQVLRNLVRNAVAHTGPDGEITITATAERGSIDVAVSDNGPGIPADQIDRIFDRFHRTDVGRARDQGGSGLGLAIARAIVEAHGGRIWAEPRPARGATIRFELPGLVTEPRVASLV